MRIAGRLAARCLGASLLLGSMHNASAEIRYETGVVKHSHLPAPVVSDTVVRLDVPHIRQQPNLCVPTSSAMILKYFGETHDPARLKGLAEDHKPPAKRNANFTYWADMRRALQSIGKRWYIRDYPKTDAGFEIGLVDIKKSLRDGNPVMIDVHLGQGHTFVIMGYNDRDKVVYIRDPDLAASHSRILSYRELLVSWHNHRFSDSRSAFFSQR
jgi:hypothetical protein